VHRKSVCKGSRFAIARQNLLCAMGGCGSVQYRFGGYVLGDQRPSPNVNHGAGIDVSPAVRDYLGLGSQGMVDWRFVEEAEVPAGPWSVCCRLEREEPTIEDVNLWRGILGPFNTKRVEPHKSEKGIPGSCFRSGSFKKRLHSD
jgi:hypothetical protein